MARPWAQAAQELIELSDRQSGGFGDVRRNPGSWRAAFAAELLDAEAPCAFVMRGQDALPLRRNACACAEL